ncbi:hypothetical protein AB0B01_09820, partial [Streptomyces sp. NPDC044571]
MRLRPTAAALLGALALVLPTAGPSLADDHDDRRPLGRLDYIVDEDGNERHQIRPADNDTCYELTGTSRSNPAIAVANETRSLALLFEERGCNGRPERVLEPGDVVHNVNVRSVFFKPADVDGRKDRRDDFDEDFHGADRSRHDARVDQTVSRPAGDDDQPSVLPAPDEGQEDQRGEEQGPGEHQGRPEHQRGEDQGQEDQRGEEQGLGEHQGRPEHQRGEEEQGEDQGRPEDQGQEQEQGEEQGQDEQRGEDQGQDEQGSPEEQGQGEDQGQDEQGSPEEQGQGEDQGQDEQGSPEE